jgi:16S rRNA (guanine(527)-N(7))-methyltransferase RsmG
MIGTAEEIGAETRQRVGDVLASMEPFQIRADFFERIERFARTLSLWGRRHNLTAEPENPSELAFHIVDCLMPIPLMGNVEKDEGVFAVGKRVLDLGSGAGLPGLVLAAATEADFILLESRRKRVSFLKIAAAEMGVGNVRIEAAHLGPGDLRSSFDVVLGRAFAKPAVFLTSALAALRIGGAAILYASGTKSIELEAETRAPEIEIPYQIYRDGQAVSRRLLVWHKNPG